SSVIARLLQDLIGDGGRSRVTLVHFGWLSVIAALALSLLGVYAIDLGLNPEPLGPGDLNPTATKQLIFLGVGLFAGACIALPHYRLIGYLAWPAMAGVVALLLFLLVPFVPESI